MKKKILLIDDDPTYLYLLKQLLKKHATAGEILTAENGSVALEILNVCYEKGELPVIIISDVEMPGMSGISFIEELKKLKLIDYALTKMVLNSNNPRYAETDWSAECPTVTYFPKPLLKEQLLTILDD